MNGTPFTPNFVGSLGQYPIYDYIDSKSNLNYQYTSNAQNQIESLKQKDLSHDGSISSLNTTVDGLVTTTATNTTAIATQATQITTLEAVTATNTTAIATNTGAIVDLNLNKVNKSSFNSTGVIHMDVAGNVQLNYDNTSFSQYTVVTGNSMVLTLADTYKNLPTSVTNNLNNNYYTRDQTSNIFITSNVLSNTSNTLADYNNLYNKPIIFIQQDASNIFVTSNVLTYNHYTKDQTSNIFVTSNVLSNTSNTLANYNNLYNRPDIYTKTQIDTNIYTKTQIDTNIYTKTQNDTSINTKKLSCTNSSTDNAGWTDTIVDFSSNFYIRKNTLLDDLTTYGDRVYLGAKNSTFNLSQNGDASIYCANGVISLWSPNNYVVLNGSVIQLKGKVQFDNGSITRKAPRFFTTSRTANFDGISCLAYDIDLTTITSSENIDGINYRHFRMKFFFANGRVDYQRTPRSFDISISSYNTFSISCFESDGYFSGLDKAVNSAYFLYKQNFNMITFCCPVSIFGTTNLKICYILEDLLGK